MLLLVLARNGVLVLEDEVDLLSLLLAMFIVDWATAITPYLVGVSTLVGTKHDHIGRSV